MSNTSTAALVASADGLPGTLKVRVAGGSFFYIGVNNVIPTTVVAVTKNTTNYIVLTPSTGVISSNTSGFTSVIFPIAVVVTVNSDIKTITDARPDFLIGTSLTATTLTVAELLALPTPVILIPTAGPNTVIVPQMIFMQYKHNTTAYTIANADNMFTFQWATGQSADVSIYATGLVDQSANAIAYTSATDIGTPALATQAVNSSFEVILTGTTPALTLGNGSVAITTAYYVVQTV